MSIQGEAQFTEEEYLTWFDSKNTNRKTKWLLKDIKKDIIAKKNITMHKNVRKYEIEIYVFDRIPRETSTIINFYKFQITISNISHKEVYNYVMSKKYYTSGSCFCHIATSVILSGRNGPSLEYIDKDLDYKRTLNKAAKVGKKLANIERNCNRFPSKGLQDPPVEPLVPCTHDRFANDFYVLDMVFKTCRFCLEKLMIFVDDCVIKLARPLLLSKFHKFYIFSLNETLPQDILNIILIIFFDINEYLSTIK